MDGSESNAAAKAGRLEALLQQVRWAEPYARDWYELRKRIEDLAFNKREFFRHRGAAYRKVLELMDSMDESRRNPAAIAPKGQEKP